MGYEKVQRLSLKKDGTLSVRLASNNITPIRYESIEIPMADGESISERLKYVFDALEGGGWQMNPSNKSVVYYYFLKAIEDVEERENVLLDHGRITVNEENEERQKTLRGYYDEVFQAFQMRWLTREKVTVTKKNYAVKVEKGWMHSKTKYGYSYSAFAPKVMPIVQAMMFKRMYDGELHEMEE